MTKPPKNECGKTRPIENPYEIWENPHSGFIYRVLKKYQRPDKEASNPYARWLVATKSPFTYGNWEMGDGYVADITKGSIKTK
tara:strand:+ start:594 stop:842 length:249 start_codon:yes stop_codon:yes gene_type:complete